MIEHAPPLGLEPTALGVRESLVGDRRPVDEIRERCPRSGEAIRDRSRAWSEKTGRRRTTQPGQRLAQERGPLRLLEREEHLHERDRVARRETVGLDRADELLLVARGDVRQRVRDRRTDSAHVDATLDRRRESLYESEPPLDPPPSTPEQPRRGRTPDSRALEERLDDARLVHDRDRAARRVRHEDEGHELLGRAPAVENDRHLTQPGCTPPLETLDAVDHLERVVLDRNGAHR